MKQLFAVILSLATFPCIFPAASHAQISDSLKGEMRKVSDELYHSGSTWYAVIDAVCDGYLPLNTPFRLDTKNGAMVLNKTTQLPLEYMVKLKAFHTENFRDTVCCRYYLVSDGVKMEEITGPRDLGWGYMPFDMVGSGYEGRAAKYDQKKIIQHLVAMMAADGIVDTSQYFHLYFNHKPELSVNDKVVDSRLAQKYATALKEDGFDVVEDIGSIHYDNNYRKHW